MLNKDKKQIAYFIPDRTVRDIEEARILLAPKYDGQVPTKVAAMIELMALGIKVLKGETP